MTIVNIYSCGCVAHDVPVLTRCEAHDGYVVAAVPSRKVTRPEVYKLNGFRFFHNDQKTVLNKIGDGSVDLIMSYPQHDPFFIRSNMTLDGKFRFKPCIFKDYFRILSDSGSMFLIVEYDVLSEALLSSVLAGFTISKIVNTESRLINEHLLYASASFKEEHRSWSVHRAGVLLNKRYASIDLPDNIRLRKNADLLLSQFNLSEASTVFDGSCIHYPFMFSALRSGHRVIGVTENHTRFASIVNHLDKH